MLTHPQLSSTGDPLGFVNAEELTAFRTALTSSLLLNRRRKVKTLTVFGCGKQAYWHVRLALLLRGHSIKHVHFINRDFSDKASDIMEDFYRYNPLTREREGWSHTDFSILTPYYEEYDRVLKEQLRAADVIFGCTPSTEPLFDHTILTNTEGRQKGRLIIAVGSYKKSMIEIPIEVISQAVKRHGSGHHLHKRVQEGGAIIVDTLACAKSTGELSQAGLQPEEVVELGELVMLEHMDTSPYDESAESMSMESLSLNNSDTQSTTSIPRTFSFSRRDTSLSKSEGGSSVSSGSSHGHHSFSHMFPHHLPKIFHKKGEGETHIAALGTAKDTSDTASTTSTSTLKSPRSPSLSSTPSRQPSSSSKSQHKKKQQQQTARENEMAEWLSRGNVVYKSIGLGLTDLVVGSDLVQLARERGVGVTIERF